MCVLRCFWETFISEKNGISGRVIKEKLTPTRGYKNLELCELGDLRFPAVSGVSYSLLTATTLFSEARTVFFLRNFSLPLFFLCYTIAKFLFFVSVLCK